ncbi:MAG TPA: D-alanyl-D-alanine carboxypeptidase/D-alanyl-D-alanine-endopeptidase, partial [Bacteroidota bacterium]|nr:D-alanyl-D-alanine carboxypeptidase/D-alanyl-D-alanine-endopeptidase [Bacteroidota bacterium]
LMNPASNVKLFTSAATIGILGKDFQLKTSVYADSMTPNGIVIGNLYLKGFGDPLLSTSDLDSLAHLLAQKKILRITGGIVADNSFFDDKHWGLGWTWDDEPDPDAPFISALTVNKGCVSVSAFSDSEKVFLSLNPVTAFIRGINTATVTRDSVGKPFKLRRPAQDRPAMVIAEGELNAFSSIEQSLSIRRPDLYAAQLFSEALQRHNIIVQDDISSGTIRSSSHEIVSFAHTLDTVVTEMNKISDNLSSENLLKILGAMRYGVPGSAKTGEYVVNSFLSSLGIDTTQYNLVDGSGVSRYNLASADMIVQLLTAMYRWNSFYSLFASSLPVAGIDGTLSARMTSTTTSGNLVAKTGTLNGVSCLSGYAKTKDGELLAFSILMQNFISSSNSYRQVQDKIGTVLTSFSRNNTIMKESVQQH